VHFALRVPKLTTVRTVNARPIYSRRVAAFLAATILAVGLVDGGSHVAIAESSSATKQTVAQNQNNRSDVQAKGSSRGVPLAPVVVTPTATEPSPTPSRARVYVFRGALGPIFSLGMDSTDGENPACRRQGQRL